MTLTKVNADRIADNARAITSAASDLSNTLFEVKQYGTEDQINKLTAAIALLDAARELLHDVR